MAKEEKARDQKDKHTERKTYKKTAAYPKKGLENKLKPSLKIPSHTIRNHAFTLESCVRRRG